MEKLTPPAVPPKLLELLKDYPDLIGRLQEILDDFAEPKFRSQPFDEAVWALQNRLDAFIKEALNEQAAAEAGGDPHEIERAKAKVDLMFLAYSRNIGLGGRSLQDLWEYFQKNKEAFE